jgi:purine-cytosine permease-like protein
VWFVFFMCLCFLCVSVPFCMCLCGLSLFLYVSLCMVCINLWMFCVLMAFVSESVRSLRGNWQKNLWRDMRFNLWRSHFIVC